MPTSPGDDNRGAPLAGVRGPGLRSALRQRWVVSMRRDGMSMGSAPRVYQESVEDTLLQRLAQDLQDAAAKLREFILKEHPVVRERYLARQRHLAAPDQPGVYRGMVRPPVRPAIVWTRVVAWTSASAMVGTLVSPATSGREG